MSSIFPNYSFAFQPIVDVNNGSIVSYEALVRGVNAESAKHVFDQISSSDKQYFDAELRLSAIRLAAKLGISCNLNLNCLPSGVNIENTSLLPMLGVLQQCHLSPSLITIEITEQEIIHDYMNFIEAINIYKRFGIKIAIDDFGSGYSGLSLLAEFQPDSIKLDMSLVRSIESRGPRQAIIRGIIRTCTDLGIDVLAEGVETTAEYEWLHDEGVNLFQGYLFAKPEFEFLPLAFYPR